jgi:DNA-binding IclR family transcriptional regulator
MTTATVPGRPNLTALGKATAVMEALAESCRLSDIARRVGLPTSSTHRILHELAELGWVEKDTDKAYRIAPRFRELITGANRGRRQIQASRREGTPR